MEPVADCDMDAFLNRSDFSPADFVCIRQAFGCLCSAILYLQEKQCRHKDIKPHNILLKGAKIYITDFGIARDWTQKGRSTTTGAAGAFSPEYAAPEVVEQQPRNSSSDIWSLGCVFLDMVVSEWSLRPFLY
jgi:serine/threonine protein kinase